MQLVVVVLNTHMNFRETWLLECLVITVPTTLRPSWQLSELITLIHVFRVKHLFTGKEI